MGMAANLHRLQEGWSMTPRLQGEPGGLIVPCAAICARPSLAVPSETMILSHGTHNYGQQALHCTWPCHAACLPVLELLHGWRCTAC